MMGFTNKLPGKGAPPIRFSLTRRVFPLASLLLGLFHTTLFGFELPFFYYLLSGITITVPLYLFAGDRFNRANALKLALLLPIFYASEALWSSHTLSFHLLALSFLSSNLIGVWALYYAALDETGRQKGLDEKRETYEKQLAATKEQVKHYAQLLENEQKSHQLETQTRDEAQKELSALLTFKQKEVEKLNKVHGHIGEQASQDRERVIALQGSLGEASSALKQLEAQAKELDQDTKRLQKALNYYRVEYFHRGAFTTLTQKHTATDYQEKEAPRVAALEKQEEAKKEPQPTAFAEMIAKLMASQKQYQEQYKHYAEQITALEKQMKGKKQESDLGSALEEHKAKAVEIKQALNDINRKIFILKKQQVEDQKKAAYV